MMNFENSIFNKAADKTVYHPLLVLEKGDGLMTTYEEFMILLTAGLLLIAILSYVDKRKK